MHASCAYYIVRISSALFPTSAFFKESNRPSLTPPALSVSASVLGPSSSLSLQSFEQSALHQSASERAVCPHGGRTGVADADNADCEVRTLGKEKRMQTAAAARA